MLLVGKILGSFSHIVVGCWSSFGFSKGVSNISGDNSRPAAILSLGGIVVGRSRLILVVILDDGLG